MVDTAEAIAWKLDADPIPVVEPIVLDADQRSVVEHRHGPLLVLAGPGTGKTATIVEAVAARMGAEDDPLPGEAILVLTFGRRAAVEVRDRIMRRICSDPKFARAGLPVVATFHSYAYALVAEEAAAVGESPPRLLSGAEEDVRVRELLRGGIEDRTIDWPPDLQGATPTLGLANEIRAVLARARALDISSADLRRIGQRDERPAWAAIGELAVQDEQVMLLENVCDYAELLRRAVNRLDDPGVQRRMHGTIRAIYVDEYQDTDPLQVRMLRRLVGPGASLVVVGDPDQAIYGFRGASVEALLTFPDEFPRADGTPASVVTLRTTRRFGPVLREAATSLLGARPVTTRGSGALSSADLVRHRNPRCLSHFPGEFRVQSFDSEGARAAWVADDIRVAHVRDHVPWDEMAVLVRGAAQLPALQRALVLAEVPFAVPAEEIPLRAEPAVAALLRGAEAAVHPDDIDPAAAVELLTGPLGGLDAGGIRRLGRVLRAAHRGEFFGEPVPASDELIARILRGDLGHVEPAEGAGGGEAAGAWLAVRRLRELLLTAHAQIAGGAQAPEVLWTLWRGRIGPTGPFAGQRAHGWPDRLRSAALAGARSANHDLDAIMALFDTAERTEGRYGGAAGLRNLLAALRAQEIPAEPVVERGMSGPGVRLLTAHRAKGLEWRRVWVAGAEEGVWPDIRQRGSVLEAARLTPDGLGPATSPADLLAEERRLFYVAITRARESVVVTTIDDPADAGSQPSRFLADLPVAIEPRTGRPPFPASLTGLVAEMRAALDDETASPAVREAAAARLAALARIQDDRGAPLVPSAHPDSWWGVRPMTSGAVPVRPEGAPIQLSGSGLESLTTCSLRWFLEREARAQVSRPSAMAFGSIVHSIAEYVAKGEVAADLDVMDALIDRIWHELRFEARWQSEAERAEARAALQRFLTYHESLERSFVDAEIPLRATVEVPIPALAPADEEPEGDLEVDGEAAGPPWSPDGPRMLVDLRGFVDRIEKDEFGRPVAIDLKNMRHAPTATQVDEHAQLGVYQILLRETMGDTGGAALVQLRLPAGKGASLPKVQVQQALDGVRPTWVERQMGVAAHVVRTEAFRAQPGNHCVRCPFTVLCPAQSDGQQVLP